MSDNGQLIAQAAQALGSGNFLAARTLLGAVTRAAPGDADSWFNLGYACRQLGDFAGAVDAYGEALRHGLSGPEAAYVNRAAILSNHLGQSEAAEADLKAALALHPDFLPAWLNLGELHEDCGRADAARAAYDRALSVDPASGRAQARLAALDVLAGQTGHAIDRLEQRCRRGLNRDDDALEILFALGNCLDADGQHDQAFDTIDAANRLSASLRRRPQRYVPSQMEALVDALCALPAPHHDAEVATDLDEPCRALFICGMFRSGSTVFEQLLGRHPAIAVGGEFETIPAFVHSRLAPYPASLHGLTAASAAAMRAEHAGQLAATDAQRHYVTDKRPDNFLHIALIKRLYPDAKFIVTRRAALDNLISIYFLNFASGVSYSDEIANIVHYMGQYVRLMAHWTALFPGDIHFVDYEALTADPESQLRACTDWLGLDPVLPADVAGATAIRTPSNWQARGPLHQRSVGRAAHYRAGLARYARDLDRLARVRF